MSETEWFEQSGQQTTTAHGADEADVDYIDRIAITTGHEAHVVRTVVSAVESVVDDLLADDHVVILESMIIAFGDSPTRSALRARLQDDTDPPDAVARLDHRAIADWLGLDFQVYAQRPLANRSLVGAEVFELLGNATSPRSMVWDVLEAWDRSFADGRPYRVAHAGRESEFETWLTQNLRRLQEHGLTLRLHQRQLRLPSGRRPDLVCRVEPDSRHGSAGDWVVVELKSCRYYPAAADQVEAYVKEVADVLAAPGEVVYGLLITDGASNAEATALEARGIAHVTLASLGYRRSRARVRGAAHDEPPPTVVEDDSEAFRTDLISVPAVTGRTPIRAVLEGLPGALDRTEEEVAQGSALAEAMRERRRTRYIREWGEAAQWPAQHPTTVVDDRAASGLAAAVCLTCTWVDGAWNGSGPLVDLRELAKQHALAHPHDPLLEEGVNPQRAPGHAVDNARRAARRVPFR